MEKELSGSALAYPVARQCPFDPPQQLLDLQADERVQRVTIWNGDEPWLVTGFDLAREVLADPRISGDIDVPGFPAANPGYFARRKVSKPFLNMDNPNHDRLRRTTMQDFTVKRAEMLRPKIQEFVDGLIDQMLAGPKPADLLEQFCLPLPSMVICEILGIGLGEREMFYDIAKVVQSQNATAEEAVEAQGKMLAFLDQLMDQKLVDPQDDLVSRLVNDQLKTERVARNDLRSTLQSILLGGFDTTSNMIALGTVALLEHPAVLDELRSTDDPELIANAVEELLRWLTILHLGRRRVALEDLEIAGHKVRAGEGVIIAHDASNRDPSAFEDPDRLDIHRRARHHLAFGYGIHQCLGQALARVELQVVYGTLYRRIPTLALSAPFDELDYKYDATVYGVRALPVTW